MMSSSPQELLDTKHEGNTNRLINRYRITTPGNDELLIKTERSKNAGPFFGALLLMGMGGFFGYLIWHGYQAEGFDFSLAIYGLFALIPGLGGIFLMLSAYVFQPSWHFKKEELVITTNMGLKKRIDKEEVVSVYLSKTLFHERGKGADSYSYWVALRMTNAHRYKEGKNHLFQVEGRDSLGSIIGYLDQKGMNRAEAESLQLAELIAGYWNIPIRV